MKFISGTNQNQSHHESLPLSLEIPSAELKVFDLNALKSPVRLLRGLSSINGPFLLLKTIVLLVTCVCALSSSSSWPACHGEAADSVGTHTKSHLWMTEPVIWLGTMGGQRKHVSKLLRKLNTLRLSSEKPQMSELFMRTHLHKWSTEICIEWTTCWWQLEDRQENWKIWKNMHSAAEHCIHCTTRCQWHRKLVSFTSHYYCCYYYFNFSLFVLIMTTWPSSSLGNMLAVGFINFLMNSYS